jgi:mono/diheme cytochrome c family protein
MSRVIPIFALGLIVIGFIGVVAVNTLGQPELSSNGRQIYFTATSQRGTPISSDMGMGMMGNGMVACAGCHGPDGRGGHVQLMMRAFDAPDIRYKALTSEQMDDHPPYTDETIKRAITQGVDPAGKPLQSPMPHWTMSADDQNDLLGFLKTLN